MIRDRSVIVVAALGIIILSMDLEGWLYLVILRTRAFLLLLIVPFVVSLIIFKAWPTHRELGWRRFLDGSTSDDLVEMVERYALDLERAGDWKQATRVYQELARRIPESAEYYEKSASRFASPPPLLLD